MLNTLFYAFAPFSGFNSSLPQVKGGSSALEGVAGKSVSSFYALFRWLEWGVGEENGFRMAHKNHSEKCAGGGSGVGKNVPQQELLGFHDTVCV